MDMNNPKNNRELSERRRRYKYGRRMVRGRLRIEASMRYDKDEYERLADLTGRHVAIHEAWFSIPAVRLLVHGTSATYIAAENKATCSIVIASCYRRERKVKILEGDRRAVSVYSTSRQPLCFPNYQQCSWTLS